MSFFAFPPTLVVTLLFAVTICSTDSIADVSPREIKEARESFWSFKAIANPQVPPVKNNSWPASPIDHFVLARLEKAGLKPAADATREVLIRRLTFDLTGLPPTEDEITTFVNDKSPNAYEKLVDRLLASPKFGERFGRHWLDVARFAESSGGGRSFMFPDAWRFRDYVINSINEDKPFDQFIIEQLAGDLLPHENDEQRAEQLVAAGFLTLGPHNYEQQDKEQLKMDVIDEQIATVGRAFMGMTLDCARCHDHKFDPVPMTDYYALAGIFRSTATMEVKSQSQSVSKWNTAALPLSKEEQHRVKLTREYIEQTSREIKQIKQQINELGGVAVSDRGIDPAALPGIVIDDTQATLIGKWKTSTSVSGFVGNGYRHDENSDKGEKRAIFAAALPEPGNYEIRLAYTPGDNRAKKVVVSIESEGVSKTVEVDQSEQPLLDGTFVSLGEYTFLAGPVSVTVSNENTNNHVIIDAVQFIGELDLAKQKRNVADAKAKQQTLEKLKEDLKHLETDRKRSQDSIKNIRIAMSVSDMAKTGDWHLHEMGLPHQHGPLIRRSFLTVATPIDENGKPIDIHIAEGQSGRMELAKWVTSPENPLTSRVLVNRIWEKLMGQGIVRSVDNFGTTGTPPTHPLLLDYLATQYIKDNWSLKTTIRRMVMSRTYRMSSTADATAFKADPENKLIGRAHRKRLDAESMRDAMLSISGEIDLTMGGHTVKAFKQYDLGYKHDVNNKRRSIYMPAFRNAVPSGFAVFDAATPNIPIGHRSVSILPTQSLYMLNAPEVTVRAKAAADRLLSQENKTIDEQIDLAYRRTLGRAPTSRETDLAEAFITSAGEKNERERWALFMKTLFASIDFRYLD